MKKLYLLLLLLLPMLASAQVSSPARPRPVSTLPATPCSNRDFVQLTVAPYTASLCQNTAWVPISYGSPFSTLGSVGIGTTSPGDKLEVAGFTNAAGPFIRINSGMADGSDFMGGIKFAINGGSGSGTEVASVKAKEISSDQYGLQFQTGNFFGGGDNLQTRMTILGTGATSIASATAGALTVGPNGTTNPVLTVDGSVASQADGVKITGNAASGGVTFAATSSGSNADITLTPKGTGRIVAGTSNGFSMGGGQVALTSNGIELAPTAPVNWSSTGGFSNTKDTGLTRNAAGVIEVNSGSAGTFRDLVARNVAFSATESGVSPAITVGSGTGITVNAGGEVRTTTYKVTITNAALSAAATTADVTIATLPAATQLNGIWADITQVFTGGAVATATMTCGKTAGGAEYLASFNVFTTTIRRGLADADLGTAMVRSAAVQGGDMPSWSATTAVQCRITTTGANTSALNQGSVTFYLRTTKLP